MPSFSRWILPISSIDSAGIYADRSAFRGLFRTREELEEQEGAYPVGGNRFSSPSGDWVPLYEGKMVQAFDHRAADITQNVKNLFRPGQQETIPSSAKRDPDRFPVPRYYVKEDPERWHWADHLGYCILRTSPLQLIGAP